MNVEVNKYNHGDTESIEKHGVKTIDEKVLRETPCSPWLVFSARPANLDKLSH